MLIEFKIQLDASGAVTPADAAPNPNLPANYQLPAAYVAPSAAATAQKCTAPAKSSALPTATPSSGSGATFIIGPIVVTGSGHVGPGGGQPLGGPGPGGGQPLGGPGPGGGQPLGGPGPGGGPPRAR